MSKACLNYLLLNMLKGKISVNILIFSNFLFDGFNFMESSVIPVPLFS